MKDPLSRRAVLGSLVSAGLVAACGRLDQPAPANALMDLSERFTLRAQRLLLAQRPLVRELTVADISPTFPTNGPTAPKGDGYQRLLENDFGDWQLRIHGLVEHPLALSLAQ